MKCHSWCTLALASGLVFAATYEAPPIPEHPKRQVRLFLDKDCSYARRNEFANGMQVALAKLDARLEALRRKAESSAEGAKEAVREVVQKSEESLADLRRRVVEIESATPDVWIDFRDGMTEAVDELGNRIFKAKRSFI